MQRTMLSLLLALSLTLAGCLSFTDGGEELEESDLPSDDEEENLEALLEANQTEGPAPLSVTFTLNATPLENGSLDWTLDPGDESPNATGNQLPHTFNHTYEDAGNYTARLSVDHANQTATASLDVTVPPPEQEEDDAQDEDDAEEDADEEESKEAPNPVTLEGTALVGHPLHLAKCLRQGVDGQFHEIAPAEAGWTYQVEPVDTFAVYWWAGSEYVDAGEDAGTVPDQATHVELCLTEGNVDQDYTVTLWHPDHEDA